MESHCVSERCCSYSEPPYGPPFPAPSVFLLHAPNPHARLRLCTVHLQFSSVYKYFAEKPASEEEQSPSVRLFNAVQAGDVEALVKVRAACEHVLSC